ncbi:MAG: Fe-S cluster assembly protein HesB [Patescibacteria group bacterium]
MLQQTQVERVVPKYQKWIKRWSNWKLLSLANNKKLLQMWSGLGYNRRAIHLGRMAQMIAMHYNGKLPNDVEELKKFSGIGPYTARAILIFAFNAPLITIDTNIRRAILHEFNLPANLPQKELEKVAWQLLPKKKSRDWHNALMDYSRLQLPAQLHHVPAQSRQSKFHGSIRQIRGEIIRQLLINKKVTIRDICRIMIRDKKDVAQAACQMQKEGLIIIRKRSITLK